MGTRVNTVRQGDCVERLKEVTAGSVDLVFADPPFNIGYDYDVYDDKRSRDEYLAWSRAWMAGVFEVLKPTGTFWLAIGDEYAAHLKVIAEDEVGFACRSWVIWYYTFGVNCVRAFSRSHTHLFHFVKDPNYFTFNAENPVVRVASARQLVYADGRANQRGRLPDNTWITRPQDAPPSAFTSDHDTWYFARVNGTFKEREGFHGCQMPEQLLGRIIRISSSPSELVLDPFAGSGTTVAVAKKLGRQWLGIELSGEYVKRIKGRLKSIKIGEPLEGPEDPKRSAPKTSKGKRRVRLRNGKPLPDADEDTRRAIVESYTTTCKGYSTDYLLCSPELSEAFIDACKKKSLPGDAFLWNRMLLRIRKRGGLARSGNGSRRFTFAMMDSYSHASEIAMQLMSLDYGLKLDDVLCLPTAASEFDRVAESFAPGYSPFEYRWAAVAIRKRAMKSRGLARTHFHDWLNDKRLPRAAAIERCASQKYEQPGVYIVGDGDDPLYVGETLSLRNRVRNLMETESWCSLGAASVRFIAHDEPSSHGLQSALIHRVDPFLNSYLLRLPFEAVASFPQSNR